jgi:adenosylmethionine-8-amino-7-oxononanoate aminotransferase
MAGRAPGDTALWHPCSDTALVRGSALVITGGEDVWLWDEDGSASHWYANVGQGRAEIAEAVVAQMRELETSRSSATEPDLITFAKGVSSGYLPVGGVIAGRRVAEPFFAQAGPGSASWWP